jgi:hypothetical protein
LPVNNEYTVAKDLMILLQQKEAFKRYHGGKGIVSQIDRFLGSQSNYGNIWEEEKSPNGLLHVIPE